jgi:hypothetical protein
MYIVQLKINDIDNTVCKAAMPIFIDSLKKNWYYYVLMNMIHKVNFLS